MTKPKQKVLEDIERQKDETSAMRNHNSPLWRLRGWVYTIEYWIIAFRLPLILLLFAYTQDFWKAAVFYLLTELYVLGANLRGLFLHIENLIEWRIDKTV